MKIPDRPELVARADALRELLWDDAVECERERRLSDRVVTALTEAGLLRLQTPRRLGGYETDMRTLLDVAIALGRGCPSAAWIAGVLNAGNFMAGLFPHGAGDEVWGDDPDARAALVLGMPSPAVELVEGGAVVSGEWAYVSGCLHAQWVSALIAVPTDADRPDVRFALMPVGEVAVKDTWYFAGMRGTGSNTVVADRVFVPEHRLVSYLPILNGETDGVVDPALPYRNSLTGLFAIGLIGALIGGAQAALDFVRAKGPNRPVAGSTYRDQTQSPTFQLDLAEATSKIDTAKLVAARIADTVDELARAGVNADLTVRARNRLESTQVGRLCREAVDTLLTAHGSSAFNESNPLQRLWRDINVGSRHAGFGMGIPEQVYGRALVGGDPREISFIV
ncbi:acyl-CoA dehydrogenase family protein [Streptomyces sp. LP11]|uniref:Acyl-CoA dehydrogenase family protein n=1 Tax=Streptomyces pyxinicus TaxID=2970331 RepID=A0ABT2B804_9ACTN|nr:acyl-CoA dehydrogenase family protein [Streptomyces sp. LP11]MCS0604645.1 acyl-CoA dehydrogenase family protein [Streptomyces sp. LP11]